VTLKTQPRRRHRRPGFGKFRSTVTQTWFSCKISPEMIGILGSRARFLLPPSKSSCLAACGPARHEGWLRVACCPSLPVRLAGRAGKGQRVIGGASSLTVLLLNMRVRLRLPFACCPGPGLLSVLPLSVTRRGSQTASARAARRLYPHVDWCRNDVQLRVIRTVPLLC
jgi:hypothetical protein